MKQTFINSLKNISLEKAVAMVNEAGHEACVVKCGNGIMTKKRPNTIVLWMKDNVMYFAEAGNRNEKS